jgi:predicted heme/steroid binding protein/uncharacterized membrane protein
MANAKQKLFTLRELKEFDGKSGKPAYVAFKGKVYDVSGSPLWADGKHRGRHFAGTDLTEEITNAPHAEEVLVKFPVVGELREERPSVRALANRIEEFHPHPMLVHFAIAFSIAIPILAIIYISTDRPSFEAASYYLLVGDFVTAAISGFSGVFSWSVTYERRMTRVFIRKAIFTVSLAVVVTTCLIWRIVDPSVLTSETAFSYVYLALLVILVPIVGMLGHYGGKIVYS